MQALVFSAILLAHLLKKSTFAYIKMLQKPLTLYKLAAKLREELDKSSPG